MDTFAQERHRGFSLPEIMMSIVLFGVGFTLSMGMFTAAAKDHVTARKIMIGTIIAENGLAEAAARLRHSQGADGRLLSPFDAPAGHKKYISPPGDTDLAELEYGPSRDKGCLIFGKYWNQTRNDYQLVAVVYDRIENGRVSAVEITCDVSGRKISNVRPAGSLRIGSPLIHRNTVRFAYIKSMGSDGTSGTLNRPLGGGATLNDYYVIQEEGQPVVSPVLIVKVSRTALRRQRVLD